MPEKGQLLSIDLLASILVFSAMLLFLFNSWQANALAWDNQKAALETEQRALFQANQLVESPGFPENWSSSDVNAIGLAARPFLLSTEKIDELASMDYNSMRKAMNLQAYDVQIEIGSDPLSPDYRLIGQSPDENTHIVVIERKIVLGGKQDVFRFYLFR